MAGVCGNDAGVRKVCGSVIGKGQSGNLFMACYPRVNLRAFLGANRNSFIAGPSDQRPNGHRKSIRGIS